MRLPIGDCQVQYLNVEHQDYAYMHDMDNFIVFPMGILCCSLYAGA